MFEQIRSKTITRILFYIALAVSAAMAVYAIVTGIIGYKIYSAFGAFPRDGYILEALKNGLGDGTPRVDSPFEYMETGVIYGFIFISLLLMLVIHEIVSISNAPAAFIVTLVGMIGFGAAALIVDKTHGIANKDIIVGVLAIGLFGCGFLHFAKLGNPKLFLVGAAPTVFAVIVVPLVIKVAMVGVAQALGAVAGAAIAGVALIAFLNSASGSSGSSAGSSAGSSSANKKKIKEKMDSLDRDYAGKKNALNKKREGSWSYFYVDEKAMGSAMRKNREEYDRLEKELAK
ncbi:MAG: hypothetical protein IJ746_06930 [Ruminococcus sp.]|nr:hypothetical protein [Ruminococcus sp.]